MAYTYILKDPRRNKMSLTKYSTFAIYECHACGNIFHLQPNEPLRCECRDKEMPEKVAGLGYTHRHDLEEHETEDHGGHS